MYTFNGVENRKSHINSFLIELNIVIYFEIHEIKKHKNVLFFLDN